MSEEKVLYHANYYKEHREKITSKLKEKHPCTRCGKMISHSYMPKHKKGLTCIRNAKISEDELNQLMRLLNVTEEVAVKMMATRV